MSLGEQDDIEGRQVLGNRRIWRGGDNVCEGSEVREDREHSRNLKDFSLVGM